MHAPRASHWLPLAALLACGPLGCKSEPAPVAKPVALRMPDLATPAAPDLTMLPDLAPPPKLRADCPPEMAPTYLGGCVDKWEASAGKGAVGKPSGAGTTVVAVSAPAKPPLLVSYHQAIKACKNAGKHLCDEHEWVAACAGYRGWRYPYGNDFEKRVCNDWDASDNGAKKTLPTGSFPKCVTPEGVWDISNNAGEWIQPRPGHAKEYFDIRGGTYNMTIVDSSCQEDDYTAQPDTVRPDIGFRCCK